MKLFNWHIPGTRDEDAEIARLQQAIAEREADLLEKDAYIKTLEQEAGGYRKEVQQWRENAPYQLRGREAWHFHSAYPNLDAANEASYRIGQETHEDRLSIFKRQPNGQYREMAQEEVEAELNADIPYQVRDERGKVVHYCMSVDEAAHRMGRSDKNLTIWQLYEDGQHRAMTFQEILQTAREEESDSWMRRYQDESSEDIEQDRDWSTTPIANYPYHQGKGFAELSRHYHAECSRINQESDGEAWGNASDARDKGVRFGRLHQIEECYREGKILKAELLALRHHIPEEDVQEAKRRGLGIEKGREEEGQAPWQGVEETVARVTERGDLQQPRDEALGQQGVDSGRDPFGVERVTEQREQFQVSYHNAEGDRTGQYDDHGNLEGVIAEAHRGRKGDHERITVFDRDKCERVYDSDEALPAKLEQPQKKQRQRRRQQQPKAPPHVLHRHLGLSQGMER